MKKIKIKFDDFLSKENLIDAFFDTIHHKKNRIDILKFELSLGKEIDRLYLELKNDTFIPSPYCLFVIYEPKEREILQPRLRDLVVQRMIYNATYDELEKRFYSGSYGTRKGKGIHDWAQKAQKYINNSDPENYYIQLDIRKYFKSIKTSKMEECLRKIFKDEKLIKVWMKFFPQDGVPIGNMLSGISGLFFLTDLDNYIKIDLKIKKYLRFMDDFILFDIPKKDIEHLLKSIEQFLDKKDLSIAPNKIKINHIKQGVNFVGYRIFPHKMILRKRNIKLFKRGSLEQQIALWGMVKISNSKNYLKQFFKKIN